jgi:acyl-CoA thioester hydrolase
MKPARIDRQRLDAATWPSTYRMPVRFVDIDTQRHVNNSGAVVYLQEGRIAFDAELEMHHDPGEGTVVVSAMVEYADEMLWPGEVEVDTGVVDIGRTSFTLAQRIRQSGKSCIFALVSLVRVGPSGTEPLTPGMREKLERGRLIEG